MDKYYPGRRQDRRPQRLRLHVTQTLVQVLKQCGDDLTRENVMKQAANLRTSQLPMLLPGIKINTSPTDFYPIEQCRWRASTASAGCCFGPVISGEIGS